MARSKAHCENRQSGGRPAEIWFAREVNGHG
jgi:hypothetical protein